MSLAGVGGTITTIVGLGITFAALGLAFEFAGRAIESTKPKSQRRKGPLVFDTSLPKGGGFGGGFGGSPRRNSRSKSRRPNMNSMFSPPKSRRGDFF